MLGDIVLIKKKDWLKAKLILPKIRDYRVIGIGGISGSSKSETSHCLQELLYKNNVSSILVSLDDYYRNYFRERMRIRKKKGLNSVGIKEIEWDLVKKIIKDFKNKKDTVQIQQINKFTNSFFETVAYNIDKTNYLIIEGIFAGYLKKLKLLDYYIHLDGTIKETNSFRLERMKENENDKFRQKIVKKEANVVAQLKKYADFIIPFNGVVSLSK